MNLDGYRRCLDCCLDRHDGCDGNAYVHHVGGAIDIVPCTCAERGHEPT